MDLSGGALSVCVRPPERAVSEAASPAPNMSSTHLSLSSCFHLRLHLISSARVRLSILFDPFLLYFWDILFFSPPSVECHSALLFLGSRKYNHQLCSLFLNGNFCVWRWCFGITRCQVKNPSCQISLQFWAAGAFSHSCTIAFRFFTCNILGWKCNCVASNGSGVASKTFSPFTYWCINQLKYTSPSFRVKCWRAVASRRSLNSWNAVGRSLPLDKRPTKLSKQISLF